jgi:putative tricarboxylic transport membrane protein
MNAQTRSLLALRLAALAIMGLGGIILIQTPQIRESAGFSVVGPRVFPIIVGIGCLIFGLLFFLRVTAIPDHVLIADVTGEEQITDWSTTLSLLGILIVYAAVLWPLGYVIATTLFFPLSSRILGSYQLRRDLLIGFLIGLIVYLTFTRLLGVRLPAGILSGLL